MTEIKNEKSNGRSKSYLRLLGFVLFLVAITDSYMTTTPNQIVGNIAEEFLGSFDAFEMSILHSALPLLGIIQAQDFIMAIGAFIITFGFYFGFLIQYLLDKFGRKKMLMVTSLGMSLSAIGLISSTSYIMYVFFLLLLCFFYNGDIFIIYMSEEAEPNKRLKYIGIIQICSLLGPLSVGVFRTRLTDPVTGQLPLGSWRVLFIVPIIIGFLATIVAYFKIEESSKYELIKAKKKANPQSIRQDIKTLLNIEEKKSYKILLLCMFLMGMSCAMLWSLAQKYSKDAGGVLDEQFTIVVFLAVPTVVIGYAINATLPDIFGRKALVCVWSILLPISIFILAIGVPLIGLPAILIAYPLTTLSYWCLFRLTTQVSIELPPTESRGTAMGLRLLLYAIGTTVGTLVGALLLLIITSIMDPTGTGTWIATPGTPLGYISPTGVVFIIFGFLPFIIAPLVIKHMKETKGVDLGKIK